MFSCAISETWNMILEPAKDLKSWTLEKLNIRNIDAGQRNICLNYHYVIVTRLIETIY